MDGDYLKRGGEPRRQLLDMIPKQRSWMVEDGGEDGSRVAEERKLELRLGPPGEEFLSLGYFSGVSKPEALQQLKAGLMQGKTGMVKEYSQKKTNGRAEQQQCCLDTKPASCPPPSHASASHNAAQTRITPTSVVGWPPIRSFRKNLASTPKPSLESQKVGVDASQKNEHRGKGLFVKINMDGIPIGRKVDLGAYDSYEKLSLAVDELFRGLLEAQRDHHADGGQRNAETKCSITGLLDGSGEYTLVYEDEEGDRMLVGDVPWEMFVSTVKRLRVLKSSELSALSLGAVSRKRTARES